MVPPTCLLEGDELLEEAIVGPHVPPALDLYSTVQYSTVEYSTVQYTAPDLGRGLGEAHAGVLQQVSQHHAGGPGGRIVNEETKCCSSIQGELTSIDAKILFYR